MVKKVPHARALKKVKGYLTVWAGWLGLSHRWHIEITTAKLDAGGAECNWNNGYKNATIKWDEEWLVKNEKHDAELEAYAIHELTHLVLADIHDVADSHGKLMELFKDPLEGTCDVLTRYLLRAREETMPCGPSKTSTARRGTSTRATRSRRSSARSRKPASPQLSSPARPSSRAKSPR